MIATDSQYARQRHIWPLLVLLLIWIAVNVGLVQVFGFSDGGDSPRYYGSAEKFLAGELPGGKSRSYLGYSLFVTPFVALGLDRFAIGCVQILLSGIAVLCLYHLGVFLYTRVVGFIAGSLFAAFPDIHYWNLVVLPDSLFTSMLVISSYLLLSATNRRQITLALILTLYTCTIRPNGVALAAALVVYGLYLLWQAKQLKWLVALSIAGLICLPILWNTIGFMLRGEQVLKQYTEGILIWGYTDNALTFSEELSDRVENTWHPLATIAFFIFEHPYYFFSLVINKLFYFYSHVRPYFTTNHNLISLAFLLPAYVFAFIGIRTSTSDQRKARVLLLSLLFFQSVIVALTFADWDARHLIPVVFVIFLYAAVGVTKIILGLFPTYSVFLSR